MRIARFVSADGRTLTGRLVDERTAEPLVGELFGELAFARDAVAVQRFLPPVQPPNIYAIGRNYRAHAAETGAALPEAPLIFMKATTAVIGQGDTIRLPASAPTQVDYEAELAIVIGRAARRVSAERALEYVLGYACANDVSARDCQQLDKQWARAKGFDTFCPLGPWLVTPDELDPNRCAVRSRLNGTVMQQATTADMIFPCRELIRYLSQQFTLLPGTVILTGTPEGVGVARRPPVFLQAGDRIAVEIEGIGALENVVAGPE
jgi:2-keto-4-pentenoate hydratase/2-oxohepta-3-ene-1,7-dioic acid hydratase in catechol pathway